MSRALRRQPLVSKPPAKSPSFKPGGPRPQKKQQSAAQTEGARRRSLLERIPIFGRSIQDIVSELKKVSWPSREETSRLTVAVIVVAVAIGIALGGIDWGFGWLMDKTVLR